MTIEEKITLIAENEQKVYDAGKNKGYTDGYTEGYDDGAASTSSALAIAVAKNVIERTITEITPSDIDALGLTKVGWQSFSRCDTLKRFISTKEQNISVSNSAFDCSALIEARIGYIVGSSSFNGCAKLQKVVIYNNTQFPWGVFQNCSSLKVVDCRNITTIPSINANANVFAQVPMGCQLVVPDHLYDTWSVATNWVAYENIVITRASDYTEYEVIE